MKRDMDLVRHILKVVEEADEPVPIRSLVTDKWGKGEIGHHMVIMQEAGLLTASIQAAGGDPYYSAYANRLTWAGHDFLDAARSDTIWDKAKDAAKKLGGSVSFDVFKSLLVGFAESSVQQLIQAGLA